MNKDYLLNQSETFCIFPWIHIMVTPPGDVYPCCVTTGASDTGTYTVEKLTPTSSFNEIINNESFKELRKNMLNGTKSKICESCYQFEKHSGSWRKWGNETFGKYTEEVIANTEPDGHLNNFKMRYYDVRFRNICNFKCRTCCPAYSSAWQDEENKRILPQYRTKPYNLTKETSVLDELLAHIDDVDTVYFAGGEPLITDEHYIILEELIRKGKTNTTVRYNTNCSVLHYKQKDVLDLWKHFDKIDVSASIDHIGERAEYVRSGTDWAVVDANLRKLKSINNITLSMNTVLSVFNYATLDMLYNYLIDNKLFLPNDWSFSLINTNDPLYFSATVLPKNIKEVGNVRINNLISRMRDLGFVSQLNLFTSAMSFTNEVDNWGSQGVTLMEMIKLKDEQRNESFGKTFPELAEMLNG